MTVSRDDSPDWSDFARIACPFKSPLMAGWLAGWLARAMGAGFVLVVDRVFCFAVVLRGNARFRVLSVFDCGANESEAG